MNEYYLDEIVPFGKHKGSTFNSVLSIDPGWIKWAEGKEIIKLIKENKPKEEEYAGIRECPF